MILLDTNVLSELMRADGSSLVLNWVSRQSWAELYTTTITRAEILAGIALLPSGLRQTTLGTVAGQVFSDDFRDRVLAFDGDAAREYAEIVALRRKDGRPIEAPDAMIAAIARVHGASIATRNMADFEGCGIGLQNPWQR